MSIDDRIAADQEAAEERVNAVYLALVSGKRVWVNGGQSGYCYGIDDLLVERDWNKDIASIMRDRRTVGGWSNPLAAFNGLTLGGLMRAVLRDAKPGTEEQTNAAKRLREVSHILAYWWAWDHADDCEIQP